MIQDSFGPIESREVNYGKILSTLLSRWYWIAGCIAVTLLAAKVYLTAVHPKYSSTASLMLSEPKTDVSNILNDNGSAANTVEQFNLTQSATFILTSEAFLSKAIARLNYRYSFFRNKRWSREELYPETPFSIQILRQDSVDYYSGMFTIVKLGGGKFTLSMSGMGSNEIREYRYGDTVAAPGLRFRVMKSFAITGEPYFFRFHTRESLIARIGNNLSLEPQNLNILSLTETDFNPYFAADALNAITAEYVIYEATSRSRLAIRRLRFIDHQLDTLARKVNEITALLDSIKKRNNIANNIPMKMQADIARLAQYEGQRATLDLERLNINQFEEQAMTTGVRLSLNFGLEGEMGSMLSNLVNQYNDQIRERERQMELYIAGSEPVKAVDKKLSDIRIAIYNNIGQMKVRNSERQRYFDGLISEARAELENIPAEAKDYIKLQTEYEINRKIFTNFTEERFKSRIELAAMAPSASVIYSASPSGLPVAPVAKRIYAMALLAGGAAGLFLIVGARVTNRKLQDVGSVLAKTDLPVAGLLKRASKKELSAHIAFAGHPDTLFAESVRNLRASLLNTLHKTKGQVIAVGSEVSGEGRSFAIINVAASLAQLDKRVVIVDADLRKPSVEKHSYAGESGLSAYLVNLKSLFRSIRRTNVPNLDILPSGVSPSQPSELLQSHKMDELLRDLRDIYDYVFIDTSPLGAFADAVTLFEKADVSLFVLRGGYSGPTAIPVAEKIIADYRLRNCYILLNGFKKNPLYQPFSNNLNTDIYFNASYARYAKKYRGQDDKERWEQINGTIH
jgi:capsular exopolysaccharide synthesis family protein